VDALGKLRGAPRDAMVADASTKADRGRNFGLLRAMDNLGAVFGILTRRTLDFILAACYYSRGCKRRFLFIKNYMIELKAQTREITGKKVSQLRNAGQIPAVLYGHGIKAISLSVDAREFDRAFGQTGETSIFHLLSGGKKHNVLVHDLARDPLFGQILHVDFYEVRMDEKLKVKIPLVFVGESPLVKSEGAILIKPLHAKIRLANQAKILCLITGFDFLLVSKLSLLLSVLIIAYLWFFCKMKKNDV